MLDAASKAFFYALSRSGTIKRLASRYGMATPDSFARRFIAGETIAEAIVAAATSGVATADWTCAINARHANCLERASDFLTAARRAFDEGLSPEFVAEDLRAAMDAVGDIVGRADTEELLGVIFSQFCIGK